VPPVGLHAFRTRLGAEDGSWFAVEAYRWMAIPAGAGVVPRLQTGIVPPQGTPIVRSGCVHVESVSFGWYDLQRPFCGQVWPQTLSTRSTQLCVQAPPGAQQLGDTSQICVTHELHPERSRSPV
jgi:hypothetical protein